jgi:hypothetical protein
MEQYWIGKGIDYDALWSDYRAGGGYIDKYRSMRVHLFRLTLREQPKSLPLFNFEAVKGSVNEIALFC